MRCCLLLATLIPSTALADPPSAVGPLRKLIDSGRIPEARLPTVIGMVTQRGNASDLQFVLDGILSNKLKGRAKINGLNGLLEAATTRKLKPSGKLSGIAAVLKSKNLKEKTFAIRLCGVWKIEAALPALKTLAEDTKPSTALRTAAFEALISIAPKKAKATIIRLTANTEPRILQYRAAGALAEVDLSSAAPIAVTVLKRAEETDDLSPLIDPFLQLADGTKSLAAAIKKSPPYKGVAKIALRYMYSVGRNDSELSNALSEAAGIEANPKPPTKAQIKAIAAEVDKSGDAARGEVVFRRAELSCVKCHSLSKAGGNVGPDLSAIGVSNPMDYLVTSILLPNQAVKEAYLTRRFRTTRGRILQGIVVDRDDDRVVLRDANGKRLELATADIGREAEGASLMPAGLTKFLTHRELLDLVKFLSVLGKPNTKYAVRSKPTVQRWRVLRGVGKQLKSEVPDDGTFLQQVYERTGDGWSAAYSKVAGELPLEGVSRVVKSSVLYLYCEVNVTAGGTIGFRLDDGSGVTLWLADDRLEAANQFTTELTEGRHRVTLRIDLGKRKTKSLRAEFFGGRENSAEFTVVGGQ